MNIAIILAGGEGKRMNHPTPKQYLKLNKRPIIFYALKTYLEIREINKILVVAHKERFNFLKKLCKNNHFPLKKIYFLEKNETRQLSSYRALEFCKKEFKCKDKDIVIFQDGVRPFTEKKVIKKCVQEAKKYKAVMAGVPSTETCVLADSKNRLKNLFPPGSLFFGKCPEAFQFKTIFKAHSEAIKKKIYNARSNYELVFQNNQPIKMVEGTYNDIKITTQFDIKIALKILKEENEKYAKGS